MKEYIERYCKLGWKIFPCIIALDKQGKVTKKPAISGWKESATDNFENAVKWFDNTHATAIGVVTGKRSGITVVDIDVKGGKNGFLALEANNIVFPDGPVSRTPTGGAHHIFRYNPKIKNSVEKIPGVDTRNDGGFIIIEPSIFPDGGKYEWNTYQEPWVLFPAPDMPKAFLDLFDIKPEKQEASTVIPDLIPDGQRNDELFRQACSFREKGFSEAELFETLRTINKRCQTPLEETELRVIASSASKYEVGDKASKKSKKRALLTTLQLLEREEVTHKLFGYNEFTDDIEFLKAPPWDPLVSPGKIVSDIDMISLKVYLSMKHGFEPQTGLIGEAIAYGASGFKYHPVRDFIQKLSWDKKPRLDTWLIQGAGCEDNAYTRAVARKVLVAAVARVFAPGCMFQYMLVLEGDQGIGKSWLVSILGGVWFSELHITEEEKDVVEYMRGRWIIEVPEMICVRKTEVDHLKAFITKTKDRVRLAYRRNATDFPRQSILIGTVNPSGDNTYLRDDTGGRRFWPVTCTKIDIAWMRVHRDQLIAEAYEAYKGGHEELHLTDPEALAIAQSHQESRQQDDLWMQYILDFLASSGSDGFTVADVAERALKMDKSRMDKSIQTRIGVILKKLKVPFKREGDRKIRKYFMEHQKIEAELVEKDTRKDW